MRVVLGSMFNRIEEQFMKPIPASVVVSIVISLSLAGCASNKIVIDKKGVDMVAYDNDLAECRAYAEETDSVGAEATKGAAAGAVVGAAIGAVLGNGNTAAKGAGVGAISGSLHGAQRSNAEKLKIVKTCLRGRGYKVLN
jgi:outer membrane lipoprotein SlyB